MVCGSIKKGSTVSHCLLSCQDTKGTWLSSLHPVDPANYFLPKRLRKRSTRPPMLSTDFWVPV